MVFIVSRVLLLLLPTALLANACGQSASKSDLHAVVLLTCDTLRADHLGLYGFGGRTSPNLDALGHESVVHGAAWSSAPLTGPALSALLTGRMPDELGLEDNRSVLSAEATTLAERLSAAGIETAAVVSNWVLRRRAELADAGVQQGFDHFDDRMESPEPGRPDLMERLADGTTDAALAWLDGRGHDRPFFLWVHYQDPHGPYTPPDDCLVWPPEEALREPELEVGTDQRGIGVLPEYQVVDQERRPAAYRARYEAEIRFFDRELGRFVEGLRARRLLERTLLVFTSDHGESLGEHGYYFSHGQNLHQELVRVPLLLRPPDGAAGTPRVQAPASHLDIFPTVLRAFGLDPGRVRGLDLLGGALPEARVLPQYLRGTWSATGARYRLLVEREQRRLYDLATDPGEERDLWPTDPAQGHRLAESLRAFVERERLPPLQAARPALDEAGRRALDSLGYGGDPESDEEGDRRGAEPPPGH